MSAYTDLRAKQKARIKSAGAMQLHRIVDLEADDYCAQEGCYIAHPMDENQGDGPLLKVTKPSKAERQQAISTAEKVAGVLLAVSIGLVGAFSLVAWSVQ